MFFSYTFEIQQHFEKFSITINEKHYERHIRLTIFYRSTIQNQKQFCVEKQIVQQIFFDRFQTFHDIIFIDRRRKYFFFNFIIQIFQHVYCDSMNINIKFLIDCDDSFCSCFSKIFQN